MKKVLAVALVGSLTVGGVVLARGVAKTQSPEGKVCVRMGELCSTKAEDGDFDKCVEGMSRVHKLSGDPGFERSQKCIEEAQSCGAATGCMMGGAGMGTLGELMKGFGSAISK